MSDAQPSRAERYCVDLVLMPVVLKTSPTPVKFGLGTGTPCARTQCARVSIATTSAWVYLLDIGPVGSPENVDAATVLVAVTAVVTAVFELFDVTAVGADDVAVESALVVGCAALVDAELVVVVAVVSDEPPHALSATPVAMTVSASAAARVV